MLDCSIPTGQERRRTYGTQEATVKSGGPIVREEATTTTATTLTLRNVVRSV